VTSATTQQVVTFRLGDDHFAVDIGSVERVLRYSKPTTVPRLPEWIEGVIDYEGRAVPVIDLRRRFGLPPTDPRLETRTIVFTTGEEWIGTVVDAVLEVTTVSPEQLTPPPTIFRGLSADYLRGLVRTGRRMLIFLEISRLLTATERLELQRATEQERRDV
jgi:purine-binding chemotaxis protein CheW